MKKALRQAQSLLDWLDKASVEMELSEPKTNTA